MLIASLSAPGAKWRPGALRGLPEEIVVESDLVVDSELIECELVPSSKPVGDALDGNLTGEIDRLPFLISLGGDLDRRHSSGSGSGAPWHCDEASHHLGQDLGPCLGWQEGSLGTP